MLLKEFQQNFMIVDTMNAEELIAEFQKDSFNVNRKCEYLVKEVRKKALRTRNKHYKKIFVYKSPKKNNWLILVDYNKASPLILPVLYYLNRGKINAFVEHPQSNAFTHYTTHFFQRYNERCLRREGLSILEIIKSFIPYNTIGTYDLITADDSDENKVFARLKDGVGLGVFEMTRKYTIQYLKTFLSSDMIGNWQQTQFNSISSDFEEQWKEVNEQLFK